MRWFALTFACLFFAGTNRATADDLTAAISFHDFARAVRALDAGADPNGSGGETPLQYAAYCQVPDTMVALLLDRGADPRKAPGGWRRSPLTIAAANGRISTVVLLADRQQATVEELSKALVAGARFPNVVRELLRRGADPNFRDPDEAQSFYGPPASALLAAVLGRCGGCVQRLLAAGAEPKFDLSEPNGSGEGFREALSQDSKATALMARVVDADTSVAEREAIYFAVFKYYRDYVGEKRRRSLYFIADGRPATRGTLIRLGVDPDLPLSERRCWALLGGIVWIAADTVSIRATPSCVPYREYGLMKVDGQWTLIWYLGALPD